MRLLRELRRGALRNVEGFAISKGVSATQRPILE